MQSSVSPPSTTNHVVMAHIPVLEQVNQVEKARSVQPPKGIHFDMRSAFEKEPRASVPSFDLSYAGTLRVAVLAFVRRSVVGTC